MNEINTIYFLIFSSCRKRDLRNVCEFPYILKVKYKGPFSYSIYRELDMVLAERRGRGVYSFKDGVFREGAGECDGDEDSKVFPPPFWYDLIPQ